MAIDKALAMSFQKEDTPILRLYTWEKSFTVGASQKTETYSLYNTLLKNNCAKRMTGGGVLFHGHDISYSLVLPTHYLENLSVKESYERICTFLLSFYKNLNLKASYAKDINTIALSKSDFCQIGYEAYDIIINGLKIGGNAQKRTKKMIFQHGSIPLFKDQNHTKEHGHCLEDLGVNLTYEEAIKQLTTAFSQTFNIELQDSVLNDKEEEYLKKLLKDAHDSTNS
jgi:lipoyl(octanoyl) transferase